MKSNLLSRMIKRIKRNRIGQIGNRSKIIKPMRIINKNRIFLGDNVIILNDARMEAHGDNASINIGSGTSIEQGCHIIAADRLEIGEDCVISAWVYIADCNHIYNKKIPIMKSGLEVKPTRIGKHVFIGIGAKIMPGVTIGDYSVIGANAVVTKNVPPNEIWAGVPAVCIGKNDILS